MTDEKLVKRLRDPITSSEAATARHVAATRIEQLIEARNTMGNLWANEKEARHNAEAKLAKAVEALTPFAKAADAWEPDDGDSGLGARIEHPRHGLERHAEFTFGDMRRARAVLAELEKTE